MQNGKNKLKREKKTKQNKTKEKREEDCLYYIIFKYSVVED